MRPWTAAAVACVFVATLAPAPSTRATENKVADAEARHARLSRVTSWRYQLRRIDLNEVAQSATDLVVVDYAPDRVYGVELPFSSEDVQRMQVKPDGTRRIVLAYLSIGEAERYRTYWNNAWYDAPTKPAWLLPPNPRWDGNFPVRFWDKDWQAIISGSPQAYLDRILAAGFDGVYLDRADVYQELESENPRAADEMASFIVQICARARAARPDVLIVMQNAEELVRRSAVRKAIDGIAKEDLFFGVEHDGQPNPPAMVRSSLADLARARAHGLKVMVVEYIEDAAKAAATAQRIRDAGFLPLMAERSLGDLEPRVATDR